MIHLRVPFEVIDDNAATVRHGSDDEIRQNVAVLLGTRLGQRLTEPEFGISDPTFTLSPDLAEIEAAIARFEPRAEVDIEVLAGEETNLLVKVGSR